MIHPFEKRHSGSADATETATTVLAWMAGEQDILSRFLALTGAGPQDLRQMAADPGFLGAILDFIMGHEPDLMRFCEETGNRPEDVAAAWQKLSGPGLDSGEF